MAIIGYMPGYAGGYIITVGLILWLKSISHGWSDESIIAQASLLQLITTVLIVLTTLIYGLTIQKVNLIKFIIVIISISLLGFFPILWIKSPDSPWIYSIFVLEGLTLSGLFLFNSFIIIRYAPPRVRGTVNSLANVFGLIGGILIIVIGGTLYDSGIYDAPFLVFGLFLVICIISFIIIYIMARKKGFV